MRKIVKELKVLGHMDLAEITVGIFKELDGASKQEVLKHAAENAEDFMQMMRSEGDIADITDALSEISNDYARYGVTRDEIYKEWRKRYSGAQPEFEEPVYEPSTKNLTKNSDGTYSANTAIEIKDDLVKNGKLAVQFRDAKDDFYCVGIDLISLEGSPVKVRGDFDCSFNELTSLKGAPKEVGGDFYCAGNPGDFTEEDVRKVSNVKGEII